MIIVILKDQPSLDIWGMKKLLLVLTVVIAACTPAHLNEEIESEKEGVILVGNINREGFNHSPYLEWFELNYGEYTVDVNTLEQLGPTDEIQIKLYLGTWCSDSQFQVPQFYKILDHLGFEEEHLKVIGLDRLEDRSLVSPYGEHIGMNITHVPTWIFYREGVEIGRIVEYPEVTIEKDMLRIIGAN